LPGAQKMSFVDRVMQMLRGRGAPADVLLPRPAAAVALPAARGGSVDDVSTAARVAIPVAAGRRSQAHS
jgi:hypothetical protein